jgi:hypothetical protein
MSKDCVICCEKINISTRKEVCCVFCDYTICRSCFQKYTLETSLDPHCMSCKKTFSNDFVNDNCTSVFITKSLKKHREDVLLDREKALLQETQPYVIVENIKRDINRQIKELYDRKHELRKQERLIENQINQLYADMRNVSLDHVVDTTEERKKFVRKCPIENCRGFLSTQWKCGSCEKHICNKCNEEKVGEHQCNPENVASMELLNKDTKPCPNCGTMIHKYVGCSQIFCVDCHTAWDWNTSRIVTGVIHNPHYYEFVRNGGNGGRNHGDIPCGGLPNIDTLHTYLKVVYAGENKVPIIYRIHQCITHINIHEIENHEVQDNIITNRNLRIKYLMNELSDLDFKTILQQNEKRRQKSIAFHNIYQMFIDVASDILTQIAVFIRQNKPSKLNVGSIETCAAFIDENVVILNNLIEYFNSSFKKIGKNFKCVYPGITKDYYFSNNIETSIRRAAIHN